MTTKVNVDTNLIDQAMLISGHRNQHDVVVQALEEFVRRHKEFGHHDPLDDSEYASDDARLQSELVEKTKRGLADADAGRVRDGHEVMTELAKKHGLTPPP